MSFREYLKALRESRGMNKADLARAIGVSNQYIVDIEAGRAKKPPTLERCQQIIKALEINEVEGKKLVELATLERASTELKPFLTRVFRDAMAPIDSSIELPPEAILPKAFDRVPILGEAPAGTKSFVHDEVERWVALPKEMTGGRRTYLLRIKGDSMVNEGIKPGYLVVVDADANPDQGDTVVIRVDGETCIKKFYRYGSKIVLKPGNPAHEEKEYNKENEIQLRGVVRGVLWKGFLK